MTDSTKLMSQEEFKDEVVQLGTASNGYYKDLTPDAKKMFDDLFALIDEQKKLHADAMLERLEAKKSEWSITDAELLDHQEDKDLVYIPLSAIESERQRNGGKQS